MSVKKGPPASGRSGLQKTGSAPKTLSDIFGRINMSDLPAMSDNVSEILALAADPHATAEALATVILKDFSLTNKILQVVNSAFYNRGVPVSSIERAVTIVGFPVVIELATTISLIEEFVKAGVEKDGISMLLSQSYLSACLSREICARKKLHLPPEEAYVCALLYNLGRGIVLVFLPDVYRRIEEAKRQGVQEDKMAMLILKHPYYEIGMELARFWNFSPSIIEAMHPDPPKPEARNDTKAMLHNLVVFSNRFTAAVCSGADLEKIIKRFKRFLAVSTSDAVHILSITMEKSGNVSEVLRHGMAKLKITHRLERIRQELREKEKREKRGKRC